MKNVLKNLQVAFRVVFTHPSYIALASALAIPVFLFAVWLPNIGLIADIFTTSSAPLVMKLKFVLNLLGGIGTNFSFVSAAYTIAIALLFGVNMAMVAYVLKRKRVVLARHDVAAGFGGMASGALGIGCAFCGSFILNVILSSLGAAGALAIFPLQGGEFGIMSIILLLISLLLISKKFASSLTCNTKPL